MKQQRYSRRQPDKVAPMAKGQYVVTDPRGAYTTNDGYLWGMKTGTEFTVVASGQTSTTITLGGNEGHHFWTCVLRERSEPISHGAQKEILFN